MAFEPKTLAELLEWRSSLPGWKWRSAWDCLEELRRLCARARIVTQGRRVLDGFGLQVGEPQPVPAEAFVDFKLWEDILTNHGELRGRGVVAHWTDLRFPNDTRHVWQAALEAGEIRAPRASSPLPEAAQLIPAAETPGGEPALAAAAHPPAAKRKRGPSKGSGGRRKGSSVYEAADTPLIKKMHAAIREAENNGSTLSPYAAAKQVADQAAGAGSFDSKVSRLTRTYKKF